VYTPLAAIVPIVLFPPGTPFTLQVTPVSLAFATLAVNVTESPRSTSLLVELTVTVMDGGGAGGGVTRPAPPPPQPSVHAPAVRSTGKHHFRGIASAPLAGARASRLAEQLSPILCRRGGRISAAIAGEGPAKSRAPRPTDDQGARKREFLYSVRIQTVSGRCTKSAGSTELHHLSV
jgi:hypothetical protein